MLRITVYCFYSIVQKILVSCFQSVKQVDIVMKRKLNSEGIEQELALENDSTDYYEPSSTEQDEEIEQQQLQKRQPGTSGGGDSNWGL